MSDIHPFDDQLDHAEQAHFDAFVGLACARLSATRPDVTAVTVIYELYPGDAAVQIVALHRGDAVQPIGSRNDLGDDVWPAADSWVAALDRTVRSAPSVLARRVDRYHATVTIHVDAGRWTLTDPSSR